MSWFTEPMHYEFFRHGLLVAVLVGGLCGLIGTMIVLRRMSYIGHGLSHAVFGGAVVAYLINVNFYLGAGLWGFLSALLINATGRRRNIGADAAIGIVTTASFALGVALISRTRSFTRNFDAALFGNILGVTTTDIMVISAVALVVVVGTFVFYRQLLFTAFDSELARRIRRTVAVGRGRVCAGAGGDDRGFDEHRRGDVDRGGDRDPAEHGPAADARVRHDAGAFGADRIRLRGNRHVPELSRGHLVRLGDRAAGGRLLRAGLCGDDAAPRAAAGAEARRRAGTSRAVVDGAESMIEISEVTELTEQQAAELADILIRIVKSGASIGWLDTPDPAAARAYWQTVVRKSENVLLLATEDGHVVGTAYLELAQRENGRHRAEVNKVLVHPDQQGKGIGRMLMEVIEASARARGRTMLHLDTDQFDGSNAFYMRCGYTPAGTVPNWARSGQDGTLHGTTFYYKVLD